MCTRTDNAFPPKSEICNSKVSFVYHERYIHREILCLTQHGFSQTWPQNQNSLVSAISYVCGMSPPYAIFSELVIRLIHRGGCSPRCSGHAMY